MLLALKSKYTTMLQCFFFVFFVFVLDSLTQCVRGSQGAGSGVLVGLRVAGGQRFSYRSSGAIRGVAGPTQGELQRGTLRETLKRRQALQKREQREKKG